MKDASHDPAARKRFASRGAELIFGSVAVAWAGQYVIYKNHEQDVAAATRNSAIAAISDLSQLTSERRERAALVRSSIRRAAPKEEIEARKLAYDEAYVRWNSQVPSGLLKIRASLGPKYRPILQDYIDGLTDAEKLNHKRPGARNPQEIAVKPGVLSIMDSCLTAAYDEYRRKDFKENGPAFDILQSCHFIPLYSGLVICMSNVSSVLYDAVDGRLSTQEQASADAEIRTSCTPPDGALAWANSATRASAPPPPNNKEPAEPSVSSRPTLNTSPAR